MAFSSTSAIVERMQAAVRAAEGEFLGVQSTIDGDLLVIFSSTATGEKLSVRCSPQTTGADVVTAIRGKIEESCAKLADRPVPVKVSVLQDMRTRLEQLSTEIHELYTRR